MPANLFHATDAMLGRGTDNFCAGRPQAIDYPK
jgi:hypothetical protein